MTASEIYDLELDSEMTVLSACNTALGEFNVGDGVRSLTRSFIHAGSKSVITSLWETPDVSTNKIIENFYRHLKEGMSKDKALRQAKLDYIENIQPSFQHPKYWAHLVLVGNTSPLEFKASVGLLKYGIMGFLLLSACLYFVNKKRN